VLWLVRDLPRVSGDLSDRRVQVRRVRWRVDVAPLEMRFMHAPRPLAPSAVRLDIQLLRAIAVGLVVVYHLWPNRLSGGFIGVDVFFVISGFLITSHLARSAASPQGVNLARFWGNRARRLLPLASIVLLASIGAAYAYLPASVWRSTLTNVIASALYVENWSLASSSVNYLARDQAAYITQHFWSLSVEEQFYIAWPLVVILATFIGVRVFRKLARADAARRAVCFAILAIFVFSFMYSLWISSTEPQVAYFATTTRAWEFAAGGLLVFAPSISRRAKPLRIVASWIGLALVLGGALLLDGTEPFPGTAALLPVVGAALFLWAGDVPSRWAPTVLTKVRPLTWIGDISYGIYLWHWPLIVIAPFVMAGELTALSKTVLVLVAIGLAAASKALIEDPFRFGPTWSANARRGFYPAALGIALVSAISVSGIVSIDSSARAAIASAAVGRTAQLGSKPDLGAPLVPTLAGRSTDYAQMFDCFDLTHTAPHTCTYGSPDAAVSIALVGDSHAAQYLPALIDIADSRGWKLTTYVGVSCDAGLSEDCAGRLSYLDAFETGRYDAVLFSAFRGSASSFEGVREYVSRLNDAGVNILAIADAPYNPSSAYACIDATDGDVQRAQKCVIARDLALRKYPDRVTKIAGQLGLPTLDLTDFYCSSETCRTVNGNVIIYQDSPSSHLTKTFVDLLRPKLEKDLVNFLEQR